MLFETISPSLFDSVDFVGLSIAYSGKGWYICRGDNPMHKSPFASREEAILIFRCSLEEEVVR
jgi:hypothetical protein